MKKIKNIDLGFQITLIAISLAALVGGDTENFSPLPTTIFLTFIQLISVGVHFSIGDFSWKKKTLRKIFHIGFFIVLAMIIFAFFQDGTGSTGDKEDKYAMPGLATILYAWIALLVLMIYYHIITWIEWLAMQKEKNYSPKK